MKIVQNQIPELFSMKSYPKQLFYNGNLELLRRGFSVSTGKYDDLEVDFVAEKNSVINYIQVTYLLSSKETEEREFRPLEKIQDNYPKMVLSMDTVWGNNRNGIERKNIIDFLLDPGL